MGLPLLELLSGVEVLPLVLPVVIERLLGPVRGSLQVVVILVLITAVIRKLSQHHRLASLV